MRHRLDKFYTKKEDVRICLDNIDLANYETIVEPSAGNGAFSNEIKNCIAFDIVPEGSNITKQDFLKIKSLESMGRILFIGNPPFGKRSSLAKKFIKKCIELNAYTIAFILPNTFKKYNNQTMFDNNWHLHKIVRISENFILEDDEIKIPCSFFIWSKESTEDDLRDQLIEEPKEFQIVSRNAKNADFSINGNNGRVKEIKDITNYKAEHFIKVQDGYDIQDIKEQLKSLNFNFNSSVNGGVAWINKNDIYKAWKNR